MKIKIFTVILTVLFFAGCQKNETVDNDLTSSPKDNFTDSPGVWEVDFADYPKGEEEFHELNSVNSRLPAP